ncbi:MAG: hypothetical protein AB7E37_00255 [Candidatus Altimarinota bacterium]
MTTQMQVKTNTTETQLSTTDISEVEQVFQEARDFRTVGERITAPIDSIISETAKIIDKDPIMNVSGELEKMNGEVQGVYKDILDNDGTFMKLLKTIPVIGGIATKIDGKLDDAKFNMKTIEGKIQVIFSGFDQSYNSINTSIDMQKNFLDGIEANLGKVIAYKDFVAEKVEELQTRVAESQNEDEKRKLIMFIQNVEFFQTNLIVLIGNLDMAKKRLEMRLDSATKLSLAMNSSRPIFKTLLSTALIETSSQKAIDASMKAMDIMGKTIDKMSAELTDKAIEGSKRAEEMSSKPVLSTNQFVENVTKLKNHFDQIEDFREQIAKEALEERKLFEDAKIKLNDMKVLTKETQEEFIGELSK